MFQQNKTTILTIAHFGLGEGGIDFCLFVFKSKHVDRVS